MKSNTVGSIKGRYDGMHESDIESSSTPTAWVCMRVAAEAEGGDILLLYSQVT